MYIFKSTPLAGQDDNSLKSSKPTFNALQNAESLLARLQAPVVPAQIAILSTPLPTGIVLSNLVDSAALAGVISTIGQPANQSYLANAAANEASLAASLALVAEEKLSKDVLSVLANSSVNVLPISSLSDVVIGHGQSAYQDNGLLLGGAPTAVFADPSGVMDVSILPPGAPVVITELSEGGSAMTVISNIASNVRIADFKQAALVSETFINTGLGVLTVTTAATNVSSLSLIGKVAFTATGIEVTSGITVSGESDSSNVSLYITGGASSKTGSSDVINLGDGDNFVFNAGDGSIFVNLGTGSNAVILAGIGASGVINLATNDAGTNDFVAVAANGLLTAQELASVPLVTITGLNAGDALSFLSDLGSNLTWANGSAQGAQVSVQDGDATNLATWITAAQMQATQAHSVAWFHFDGATYIFETVAGAGSSYTGDTLVRLTGTMTLVDGQVELSQGLLQFLG